MKRYLVIETLDQVRAVSDPLRLQILTKLIRQEYTGKQLATLLSASASKVHYHLKELETQGFVEVVRTEEKNGIVQKFYRAVAYDFVFSEDLLPTLGDDSSLLQESMLNQLREAISRIYEAPEESFRMFANEAERLPSLCVNSEIKAPKAEIKSWLQKYEELLEELNEMEKRHLARIEAGEEPDDTDVFFMVSVGFMTNERFFVADDESLPDGYQAVNRTVARRGRKEGANGQE